MFGFARQVCKLKTATLWLPSMHVPKWNNSHMKYCCVFDFHYWSFLPFDLKQYVFANMNTYLPAEVQWITAEIYFFLRLRGPVETALKDVNLSFKDLDEVILVGGSTCIPAV